MSKYAKIGSNHQMWGFPSAHPLGLFFFLLFFLLQSLRGRRRRRRTRKFWELPPSKNTLDFSSSLFLLLLLPRRPSEKFCGKKVWKSNIKLYSTKGRGWPTAATLYSEIPNPPFLVQLPPPSFFCVSSATEILYPRGRKEGGGEGKAKGVWGVGFKFLFFLGWPLLF